MAELLAALERLERTLIAAGVPGASRLRPGLSRGEFERLMAPFPHTWPAELVEIYGWHDGVEYEAGVHTELFPGFVMLSLDGALRTYEQLREADRMARASIDDEPPYDDRWFPLFQGGPDDWYVVVCGSGAGTGEVWFAAADESPERRRDFVNVLDLVETVQALYAAQAYSVDGGRVLDDLGRTRAVLRERHGARYDVEELLREFESAPDRRVRKQAFNVLVRFAFPETLDRLITLLGHPRPDVSYRAALLLGDIGGARAIRGLMDAATGPDLHLRYGAVASLLKIGDPVAADAIRLSLAADDPRLRLLAAAALKTLGDARRPPA